MSNVNPTSTPTTAPPTPASPPALVTPAEMAWGWCTKLTDEPNACYAGVQKAVSELNNGSSTENVVQMCSQYTTGEDQYSGTSGYRQGCYLAIAYAGNTDNLCTATYVDNSNQKQDMPFVCAKTCKTIYPNDSDKLGKCESMAGNLFHVGATKGICSRDALPCIDMTQSTYTNPDAPSKSYDCGRNPADNLQHCLPNMMGCSLGNMQSSQLSYLQEYEYNLGNTVEDCRDFDPNYTSSHWYNQPTGQFPFGPTYKPTNNSK